MITSFNILKPNTVARTRCVSLDGDNLNMKFLPLKRKGYSRKVAPSLAKLSKDVIPTKNFPELAEKLNGRLAMLGFVSGTGYELISGMNYLDQLNNTWPYALCLVGVVTFASLKTRNLEVIEELPFTTNLELLNGRMAMLGLLCKFIYDSNLLIH